MNENLSIQALKKKILKHRGGNYYLSNEILQFEYKIRKLPLPNKDELVQDFDYRGALKKNYYKGIYRCLFKVDFKNYYPSIIKEFDLKPSWDKYGIFSLLVDRLVKISNMNLNADERRKIKQFMVYFCYGFIAYRSSPFCDREYAGTVARKGRKILQRATYLLKKIQPSARIILANTDGFISNIKNKNFNSTYIDEAKRITNELNKLLGYKFIRLKFEGFYTEGRFYDVDTYYLYNEYTDEYVRKPNTRPLLL